LNSISINLNEYRGGIGVWGAVAPLLRGPYPPEDEPGVHLHARKTPRREKEIDASFSKVTISNGEVTQREVVEDEAVGFMFAQILQIPVTNLACESCGADLFLGRHAAISPTKKHKCMECKFVTKSDRSLVANPLADLHQHFDLPARKDPIVLDNTLSLTNAEIAAGVEMWASNPAIIWTAERPEEAGIHVHVYDNDGKIIRDDTFCNIEVDGVFFDIEAARIYMVQREFPNIEKHISNVDCAHCSVPILAVGLDATTPKKSHKCQECERVSKTVKTIIPNPVVAVLKHAQCSVADHLSQ
jgi:hypothetical protein